MKNILLINFVLLSLASAAQTGSEIYLFDLNLKKDNVQLTNGKNITKHIGYDNQPYFHTDLPLLYYSSFNNAGRADILGYNFKTKETESITNTEDREYSPTLTPDKLYISCIVQRDNGAQDLVKYTIKGGEPTVLVDNLVVGYHAWADSTNLALFVLGKENEPATLHFINLQTKRDTILAEDIGRSLHKIPGKNAISFIHKVSKNDWLIKQINTETLAIETIAPIFPGKEDIAWTPTGLLLLSDGEKIFVRVKNAWQEVQIISSWQPKGITRMAVRADGKKMAVVVSE
jgi:hypothetical protein